MDTYLWWSHFRGASERVSELDWQTGIGHRTQWSCSMKWPCKALLLSSRSRDRPSVDSSAPPIYINTIKEHLGLSIQWIWFYSLRFGLFADTDRLDTRYIQEIWQNPDFISFEWENFHVVSQFREISQASPWSPESRYCDLGCIQRRWTKEKMGNKNDNEDGLQSFTCENVRF
jgi:hypothetical protein